MRPPARPTLSVPGQGLVDPADDKIVPLAAYDLLLPCRKFRIEHKVAVLGRVSLTAEFLLRLIKSLEGIAEEDAATFFGFDRREMSYVLNEVMELGYVDRRDGRLWLSTDGHSLFRDGSAQPEIFEVEKRVEVVGFDLLSLAPARPRFLERFELRLPELKIEDAKLASAATSQVPRSFRRFYPQLSTRKDPLGATKRSLYSIDAVSAADRFSVTVPVTLTGTGLRPAFSDVDLSDWLPEHEQDERPEVVAAISAFRDELLVSRRPDDREAYQCLADVAPEFLKDFTRADGLAIDRYYREAFSRAGEARVDRATVPILGSLLLQENVRRLGDVLGYGLRGARRPEYLIWLPPQVAHWGATRILPGLLKQFGDRIGAAGPGRDAYSPKSICLIPGRGARHLEDAFGQVFRFDAAVIPPALEIFLVPGVIAAVVAHCPIGAQTGLPVPLGFASFDAKVLERVEDFVSIRTARIVGPKLQERLLANRMTESGGSTVADQAGAENLHLAPL